MLFRLLSNMKENFKGWLNKAKKKKLYKRYFAKCQNLSQMRIFLLILCFYVGME